MFGASSRFMVINLNSFITIGYFHFPVMLSILMGFPSTDVVVELEVKRDLPVR